jgi:signal transduction histidine kinase
MFRKAVCTAASSGMRFAVLVVFACATAWTAVGEARGSVTITSQALDVSEPDGILVKPAPIRYRLGDDPQWKEPGFNDEDWDRADIFKYPLDSPRAVPPFPPIWFRFDLHFTPDLIGRPVVLTSIHFYEPDAQVFLNGTRVADLQFIDPTTGKTPRCIVPFQADCVVALRWNPEKWRVERALGREKEEVIKCILSIRDYEAALRKQERLAVNDHAYALHRIVLIGAFIVFFLFHFALYAHYPLRRENIYYGMTALLCLLALTSLHVSEAYRYSGPIWYWSYAVFFLGIMPFSVMSGAALLQLLLTGRVGRALPVYLTVGILLQIAHIQTPWVSNTAMQCFPLVVVPELAWSVWLRHRQKGLPFGWMVVGALLLVCVVLSALGAALGVDSNSGFIRYAAWYFFAFFLQIVAVAFAREYARDKKHLEARTVELAGEIAERRRAEEAFQGISRRLLDVRDEERRRMARELHDSVAQDLAAMVMMIGQIEDGLPGKSPEQVKALESTLDLANKCAQEVRTLSYLLHPPLLDQLGLVPALRAYVDGFTKRSGIRVAMEVEPDFARMPADVELTLFRIVQECLGNIHRHSHSASARVTLGQSADTVLLEVRDEGDGIPQDTLAAIQQHRSCGGVGVAGMQERLHLLKGTFHVESGPGGTMVQAAVPLGNTRS